MATKNQNSKIKINNSQVPLFAYLFLSGFFFISCFMEKNSGKNKESMMLAILLAQGSASQSSIPADSANSVVDAPNDNGIDYRDKKKAINGVRGGGCCGGSSDVFSLTPTGS
ncbi:MAG: hypothetical protein K8R21_06220, partial [Leptospira sp.]|nr:hypothetical protein [Leptospira sp.]